MRIGIDYTAAVWQGAGIGRYTRELIQEVIRHGQEFEYILFYAAGGLPADSQYLTDLRQLCAAHPHVAHKPLPFSPRRAAQLWQRLRIPLPIEWFTGRLDLLHSPDFVLPPTRARTLLTVHDLSFLVHPECHVPNMVRYLSSAVPRSVRRANRLFADSEATRADLERLLQCDPQHIEVVYPGVTPRFQPLPAEQTEPVRQRLGLPERFLLFVGTLEPRKNLVRLVEAFAMMRNRQDADSWIRRMPLVLAGRRGWLYESVFETIERLGLSDAVRVLDYVDDKDLPALYNLAWTFTYPSIYEGFGLPALEALACGTPVVTAQNSSLPEVVGDAALLVPADDVVALANALERSVTDDALRVRLRSAGLQRAQEFTWQRAGQQVLACYRQMTAT
jgi:glycosyltransferase involved in cell wall biosynthesis